MHEVCLNIIPFCPVFYFYSFVVYCYEAVTTQAGFETFVLNAFNNVMFFCCFLAVWCIAVLTTSGT